jgi:drug/metabolite transporter (DMT)-like permease
VGLPRQAAQALEAAGVLISLGGALTIVARGELQVLARLDLNIGDLWMLLAVLDWALYTIALAWRPAGLHSMLMLGATIGIGIAALAPACAWELAHGARPNVSPGTLATVAYLGIVPGVFSYIFYNRGVVEVGATAPACSSTSCPCSAPCCRRSSSARSPRPTTTSASR